MRVLITGCDRVFPLCVANYLAPKHEVVRVGRSASAGVKAVDLFNPEETTLLMEDVQAVVHADAFDLGSLPPERDEDVLDGAVRGAYVVLDAARTAGVQRAIGVTSLDVLEGYPGDFVLDETFRPIPEVDALSLAPYLVEQTFREYARVGPMASICLRFATIDAADGTPADLALRAVERALDMALDPNGYRWFLYNVCGTERHPLRAATGPPLSLEAVR